MIRPIVLLDCDGPLADFTGAYLQVVEKLTGYAIDPNKIDRWSIKSTDAFAEAARRSVCTVDQLARVVHHEFDKPGWCGSLQVQQGAQFAVEELCEFADVYIVTSPWRTCPTWLHERQDWVDCYFPKIGADRIIATHHKHLVCGDVFVDDKFPNVYDWGREWGNFGRPILFDLPHNRNDVTLHVRGGWYEVLECARSFLG